MQAASGVLIVILGLAMIPFIVAPPEKTEIGGLETEIEGEEAKIEGGEMKIEGEKTKIKVVETEIGGEETKYKPIETTAETTKTIDDSTTGKYMKRNFGNKQKEMQQVSDNMTTRQQFVTSPRESVSVRTEQLLREAHGLLKDVNSNKKRFWLEAFAYFLEHMLNKVNPDRKLRKSNASIEEFLQTFSKRENKESLTENTLPLTASNRKSKEFFMQSFATALPPVERGKQPVIPSMLKSMQSDYATFTSLPESTANIQNSPVIKSLETSNIQLSMPIPESPITDTQEFKRLQKIREIQIPQESYDESASLNTNVPQESTKEYNTSEISTTQEPNNVNESPEASENHQQSSSALPLSSEKDSYLPNLATPVDTVPEASQLQNVKLTSNEEEKLLHQAKAFDILGNHVNKINGPHPSKNEWVDYHLQEINYVDELQKELMEVARLQALEKAPKNSSVSVNSSDISPSTTTSQRNSFLQEEIDEKSTATDNQLKLSILPQSTEDGSLTNSVTALYDAVPGVTVPDDDVVQVASEAQPSVPKIEQDIPILVEQEVVPTAITQTDNKKRDNAEDDELVRELEELPGLVALERARAERDLGLAPSVNPTDTLTPGTIKRNSLRTDYRNANEEEKRKIEINLVQEIRELRHLGATDKEIIEALGINKLHLPGIQELEKIGREAGIHNSHNSNYDKTATYKINPNTWKPLTHPYTQQSYSNDTFGGMHTNIPHMNVVANQYQGGYRLSPYRRMHVGPRNIQNMLHKLQHENYFLKTQLMPQTNGKVNKLRGITYPGPNHVNSFLPHEIRYPSHFSLSPNVQGQRSLPVNHPSPYTMNSDLKNFTLKENANKESALISKPLLQNTVSEFTDEMKRELRDGKVILLSDSVVHSNFGNEKGRDGGGKQEKEKASSSGVGEAQVPAEN